MTARRFSLIAIAGAGMLAFCSCRREAKPTPVSAPAKPSAGSSISPALAIPPADPRITAAVDNLHRAEREWLAQSPEAAAAFKRLTDAQAAYMDLIGTLGLYTLPARERDGKAQDILAAREKGDAVLLARAEKEFEEANARVEAGEAKLRLGNPPIKKAYDEWLATRKAYAELKNGNEAISKASAEMTQMTEQRNSERTGTQRPREGERK